MIGAMARDLIFEYVHDARIQRTTEDIDFAVAVESWSDYDGLTQALLNTGAFRKDTKQEQRLWWTNETEEMRIDIVPFGGLETQKGTIAFPPFGDFKMSTHGFREVSEKTLSLNIADDLEINIVPLAGLVLLKFIAFSDRPDRKRDIQDIWFVASNYLDAGNEDRLYDPESGDMDLLDNEDFNLRFAGARLLGRDLAQLLNSETRKILSRTLGDGTDEKGLQKLADEITTDHLRESDRTEFVMTMLREFNRGLQERSLSE